MLCELFLVVWSLKCTHYPIFRIPSTSPATNYGFNATLPVVYSDRASNNKEVWKSDSQGLINLYTVSTPFLLADLGDCGVDSFSIGYYFFPELRHVGRSINYGFFDGHAESLRMGDIFYSPARVWTGDVKFPFFYDRL